MNADNPSALIQAGLAHHQAGNLDDAEAAYRKVLDIDPDHADAHHLMGVLAFHTARYDMAVDHHGKALALLPDFADAHANLGNALRALGRLDDAVASYRRAIRLKPEHAKAHNNLGGTLQDMGHLEDAAECYRNALAIDPDFAEAHGNLGTALMGMGQLEDATECFNKVIAIDPEDALAHYNLGSVLQERGKFEDAAAAHRKAIGFEPDFTEAHNNLGTALQTMGRLEEAAECYRSVLELNPAFDEARNNFATVLQKLGHLSEAAHVFRGILATDSGNVEAGRNLLYLTLNIPGLSVEEIFAEHLRFSECHARDIKANADSFANIPDPDRRLKIGYVSSDFRDHAVGSALLPVLSSHDRAAFEIFCYADIPRPDAVTEKFRGCADHWRPTFNKSDAQVAEMIRADGIDALLSVAGHFDRNRPLVPAYRTAPVQVSFHDGATSGLAEMDYWLTDDYLHPPNTPEIFTEELYRLPAFYQWPPIEDAPEVSPLPAEHAGFITFASFNNPSKLNAGVLKLWAEILKSVPASQLLLKFKNLYDQPTLRDRILGGLDECGVDVERVELASSLDSINEHLARYAEVDIALDPFPFNGATTTYQTLWMGVPVISLSGETFISRATGSVLHHVGLDELVAETSEDYVRVACDLAGDLTRLKELRSGLRDRVASSPLCNASAYTGHVEAAFRDMWRRWCEKPN